LKHFVLPQFDYKFIESLINWHQKTSAFYWFFIEEIEY